MDQEIYNINSMKKMKMETRQRFRIILQNQPVNGHRQHLEKHTLYVKVKDSEGNIEKKSLENVTVVKNKRNSGY